VTAKDEQEGPTQVAFGVQEQSRSWSRKVFGPEHGFRLEVLMLLVLVMEAVVLVVLVLVMLVVLVLGEVRVVVGIAHEQLVQSGE
jgi:hypothetical protein